MTGCPPSVKAHPVPGCATSFFVMINIVLQREESRIPRQFLFVQNDVFKDAGVLDGISKFVAEIPLRDGEHLALSSLRDSALAVGSAM